MKCKFCDMGIGPKPKTKYYNLTMMEMHVRSNHGDELQGFIESFFVEDE